jgi:hypothetical protein
MNQTTIRAYGPELVKLSTKRIQEWSLMTASEQVSQGCRSGADSRSLIVRHHWVSQE